ncbi:MAG: hypothetical protein FD153_1730 [Rhodospirillaceae bacterium]|nr:MAG: hypothetical protein FD153_1730 [Rhodospirillaceae bacterium]
MSDRWEQVALRVQAREDAVSRVQDFFQYEEQALQAYTDARMSGALETKDSATQLRSQLFDLQKKAIESHQGSRDSSALLTQRLQERRAAWDSQITLTSLDLRAKKVEKLASSELNRILATGAPIEQQFNRLDRFIESIGPSIPADEAEALAFKGRSEIVATSVNGLVNRGAYKDARELMAAEHVAPYLSPATQRSLLTHIDTVEGEVQRAQGQAIERLRSAEAVIGRPLTLAERLQMTGLAPPASESKPVSLSPGSVLVDPRTGRVVAQAPQAPGAELDLALKRENLVAARQKNEEVTASKENSVVSTTDAIEKAEELLKHPGRQMATGGSYVVSSIPGTSARGFNAELENLKAELFLPAVQQLKGMGALSDAEGKKLEHSVAALDPGMPEEEFEKSLKQLIKKLKVTRDGLKKRMGQQQTSSSPPTDDEDNDLWDYNAGAHKLERVQQ